VFVNCNGAALLTGGCCWWQLDTHSLPVEAAGKEGVEQERQGVWWKYYGWSGALHWQGW